MDKQNEPITQIENEEDFNVKEDRMFSKDEVNKIIQGRLKSMHKAASKKAEADYKTKLAELELREKTLNAKDILKQNNMPEELAELLAGSADQEGTLNVLKKFINTDTPKIQNTEKALNGFQVIGGATGDENRTISSSIKEAMGY